MAKKKNVFISAVLSLSLIMTGCSGAEVNEEITSIQTAAPSVTGQDVQTYKPVTAAPTKKSLLECRFFMEEDFYEDVMPLNTYETDGTIICATIPHHLLAGDMIASVFRTAVAQRDIDTVVIVSPIHEPEGFSVCTSLLSWDTPFGVLETDQELSQRFIDRLGAEASDYMVQKDHSASSIIPYVKYFLPEAKTACVLMSKGAHESFPSALSEILAEYESKKNCLFLFATDFSHYLQPYQADEMDEQTRMAVFSKDYHTISAMTNSHVDSPHSLETFVRLSERLSLPVNELDSSNTLHKTGNTYDPAFFPEGVTSYLVFAGCR